ncbi:hypothetical protein ACLGGT_21960 [Roseovarius sp. MS2]
MRKALAQAALDSAPPDLVIFDEFQCYRDLLNAGEDNPLARQLLEGQEGEAPRRSSSCLPRPIAFTPNAGKTAPEPHHTSNFLRLSSSWVDHSRGG